MMRYTVLWLSLILLPSIAWAEVSVIYRTSDKAVCSWVVPPQSVEVEKANCAASQLGGTPADYSVTTTTNAHWATKGDKDVTINPGGQVVFLPNAAIEDKKAKRASGKSKLQAGTALTAAEVTALFGAE